MHSVNIEGQQNEGVAEVHGEVRERGDLLAARDFLSRLKPILDRMEDTLRPFQQVNDAVLRGPGVGHGD